MNGGEDAVVSAIVEVIADARGEAPTEVNFRLYDYLDSRVFELLTASSGSDVTWELTLDIDDVEVTVQGDDHVTVHGERVE